jgi:glucan biosynthesis protein C
MCTRFCFRNVVLHWTSTKLRPTYRYGESISPTTGPDGPSKSHKILQPSRIYYLDSLKTFCTAVVIAHHTAVAYGGRGGWQYREHPEGSNVLLALFNGFNQSWFMGAFFLMSRYFAAESEGLVRRDGSNGSKENTSTKPTKGEIWTFYRRKLLRLGVPLIFGTILVSPIASAIGSPRAVGGLVRSWTSSPGIRGISWYLGVVLIFDTVYSAWMYLDIPSIPVYRFTPPIAVCADIVASFIVRLWWPASRVFAPLHLKLGYVPQYILAYSAGVIIQSNPSIMHRRNPIREAVSTFTAVSLTVFYFMFQSKNTDFEGGWNRSAVIYAIWNEVGFCIFTHSAWELCRRYWNRQFAPSRWAYPAFWLHPVVTTWLQVAVSRWKVGSVAKTAAVGVVGIVGSFVAGWGLLKVPEMARIF